MTWACWAKRCDSLRSISESELSWTGGPGKTAGDSRFSINWSVFVFGMRGYILSYLIFDFMV